MTATTNALIQPFNIDDPEDRDAMFNAKPPENLTLSLFLRVHRVPHAAGCNWPRGRDFWKYWDEPEPEKALVALVKSCTAHSTFPNMDCEVIYWSEDDDVIDVIDQLPLNPMEKFMFEIGVLAYPQVGFRNRKDFAEVHDPHKAIYSAMTVNDVQYLRSGSLNPKDHYPIEVSELEATVFRSAVNDTYLKGLGVWSSVLVNLRNEVKIKAQATIHGSDPDVEWKRFCDTGMAHFFDSIIVREPPTR